MSRQNYIYIILTIFTEILLKIYFDLIVNLYYNRKNMVLM